MSPEGGGDPGGAFGKAVDGAFGGADKLREQPSRAAARRYERARSIELDLAA